MPTGYTSQLDDNNLTAEQWLTEVLPLNFGFCHVLYDSGLRHPEAVIAKEIADDHNLAYYIAEYDKAVARENELFTWTKKKWISEYKAMVKRLESISKKSIKETGEFKRKHDKVRADLLKLQSQSKVQVVQDVVKYALSQLDLVEDETKPYITNIPILDNFIEETEGSVKRDIKYFSERIEEKKRQVEENKRMYADLTAEVHRVLGKKK